jgi:hypothetical protein
MINAEKQRLTKAQDRIAQRSFKALLKSLEAERARIDTAIDNLSKRAWSGAQQDLLKRVPGIGDIVARTLMAECPSSAGSIETRSPSSPTCPNQPRQRPLSRQTQIQGPRRGPGARSSWSASSASAQPGAQVLLNRADRRLFRVVASPVEVIASPLIICCQAEQLALGDRQADPPGDLPDLARQVAVFRPGWQRGRRLTPQ